MKYILFNPKAKGGEYEEQLKILNPNNDAKLVDVWDCEAYDATLASLTADDEIYVVGGDGTLNRFVNRCKGNVNGAKAYFVSNGTGNDFLSDVVDKASGNIVPINDLIVDLPIVKVNGEEYYFINGIGFGIDGYCCEVGDAQHAAGVKNVNYAGIAVKGLLFHYKAPNATVIVDGVEKKYKRCWLAPTMKGKFYGGGMKVAPAQDRLNSDKSVTNVVWHKTGKIKTLMRFTSIFKGEHVKYTKMIDIRSGHNVKVIFDRPTALQIDGETISGVTEYEVIAK